MTRPGVQRCRFRTKLVQRYGKWREVRVKVITSNVVCPEGHRDTIETEQELPRVTHRSGRAF